MMQRFIDADIPRYVAVIESSPSYRQALLKLGITGHDYEVIKWVAQETGVKLMPFVPKPPPAYYGPYYNHKRCGAPYIVVGATKQRMSLARAKILGIVPV